MRAWLRPAEVPRSPHERLAPVVRLRVGAEIVVTYAEVRWRLLRGTVPEAVSALRRELAEQSESPDAHRLALRLGHPVRRTLDPLPWDSRCLMRSLVLLRMLARRGIFARLVIGVRPGETFGAHAWVEHDGQPLLPTLGYAPLSVL